MNQKPQPCHTISLQAGWEGPVDAAGGTVWGRSFGRPVDFPAGDRLVLRIDAASPPLKRVVLNGAEVPIPANPSGVAHDVTRLLAARNLVQLHLRADPAPGTGGAGRHAPLPLTVARVWLEVYRAADEGHA